MMVQDIDAPTLDEIPDSTAAEIQEALGQFDIKGRDPNIPEGELLGEATIQDVTVRRRKQSSMVHYAGRPLPERIKVFDRKGIPSLVATAQLAYHLGKTDRQGNKKFFAKPPPGTSPPQPIDQTCEICLENNVRKKFFSKYAWRNHMVFYHPNEFEMMKEEREEARATGNLIEQLRQMTPQQRTELAALFNVAQNPNGEKATYPCGKCGRSFDTPQGRHLHETKWCKEET